MTSTTPRRDLREMHRRDNGEFGEELGLVELNVRQTADSLDFADLCARLDGGDTSWALQDSRLATLVSEAREDATLAVSLPRDFTDHLAHRQDRSTTWAT